MNPITTLYAVWYDRLIAYIIDALALALPGAIAVMLMGGIDAEGKLIIAPASALVVFLINMAYFVCFLSGRWQATLGMRAMAIHLIRTDGRALSQRDGLERYLAFIIPSLPMNLTLLPESTTQLLSVCLSMLWFLPIISTRIGLHDRLCSMRVINGRLP